jgi:hypothetical protein
VAVDQSRPRTAVDLAVPRAVGSYARVLDRAALSVIAASQARTRTVTLWSPSMISYIII